jgi:hypothetical protein
LTAATLRVAPTAAVTTRTGTSRSTGSAASAGTAIRGGEGIARQLPAGAAAWGRTGFVARLVATAEHKAAAGLGATAAPSGAASESASAAWSAVAAATIAAATSPIIPAPPLGFRSGLEVDEVAKVTDLARLGWGRFACEHADEPDIRGPFSYHGERLEKTGQAVAA